MREIEIPPKTIYFVMETLYNRDVNKIIYETINRINYDVKRVYRNDIDHTEDTFQVALCTTGVNIGFSKYYEMVEEEDV